MLVSQSKCGQAQYTLIKPRIGVNLGAVRYVGRHAHMRMGVVESTSDSRRACINGGGSIQMNIKELATVSI